MRNINYETHHYAVFYIILLLPVFKVVMLSSLYNSDTLNLCFSAMYIDGVSLLFIVKRIQFIGYPQFCTRHFNF